jgi:multiple sugar transport system permease protein
VSLSTRRNLRNGLLFVSPWIVGFTLFNVWPLINSLYYSLCDYSVLNPPVFIGMAHYQDMLGDAAFKKSLTNTVFYAAMALPLGMIVALALALLLHGDFHGRALFRAIVFVPSLVPLVAMALLMQGMFNGDYGVLNWVLSLVGIDGPNWLGNPLWMKPALVLMSLYMVGNAVVIYLAGLQDVPRHLYESAEIDGASWWRKTWHITFPMISPVIYFNLMISCIFVLQTFVQPYVMFDYNGGADRAALFYTMHLINQGFLFLRMGYACAMAWVLFVFIALLPSHRTPSTP